MQMKSVHRTGKQTAYDVKRTRLTDENGKLYEDIVQSYIGNHLDSTRAAARYLYDAYTYDSDLEQTNLRTSDIDEVIVFGKIPRKSIAIPTITNDSYSPDFMYKEDKGNYFLLRDNEQICDRILDAFGVKGQNRHIINGHVPVHASKGENPIKANGKLMVIDGGFSEAYHSETGIAGYTLVYHSRGFQLVQHEPFTSAEDAILRGLDIKSTTQLVELSAHRMLVADTDKGEELRVQVEDLRQLLYAYRHGILKERK